MSKALLNIDKFPTGIINDETKQTVDGFVDLLGIDMISEPWIAQINKRLNNDTASGLSNNVLSAVTFDGKILVGTEDEEIWYENTANTWTLLHTNTNSWDLDDLIVYQDHLIYASTDEIGRSTNTTIAWWFTDTPTWGAGTNAFKNWVASKPHFFKVFNNRLYISDGNVLAELDGASDPANPWNWVFNDEAFKLPENEVIVSMEVIWNILWMGTEAWNYYEWDGASSNASTIVKSNLGGIHALIQIENTLFAFAWLDGVIYRFNGADFKPDIKIPSNRFNVSATSHTRKPAIRRYRNGFIFAIPNNGIYVYDRVDSSSPFMLSKYWNLSWGALANTASIKLIYVTSASDDLFIVWYNTTADKIDSVDSSKRYRMYEAWSSDDSASPFMETQVYELRDNNWKPNRVQWVQWFFTWFSDSDIENNMRVYFRLNNSSSYTLLWDIWEDGIDVNKILRWISKRAHQVQMKILLWAETTSSSLVRNTKISWVRIF